MRLLTDEQHEQIVKEMGELGLQYVCRVSHHAKKDEHEWSEPCPVVARYQEALATLTAAPSVEVAAYASYGEEINKPLYAIKKETP